MSDKSELPPKIAWEFVYKGKRYGAAVLVEPTVDHLELIAQNMLETFRELEKDS